MKTILGLLAALAFSGCSGLTQWANAPETKQTLQDIVSKTASGLSQSLAEGSQAASTAGTLTGNPLLIALGGILGAAALLTRKKDPPVVVPIQAPLPAPAPPLAAAPHPPLAPGAPA